MKKQLDAFRYKLEVAERFAAEFEAQLKVGFPGHLSLDISAEPTYSIFAPENTEPNRERILGESGRLFGTHGWSRHLNYTHTAFDWKLKVSGVMVVIHGAEMIAKPMEGTPVLPKLFPVLLKEEAES